MAHPSSDPLVVADNFCIAAVDLENAAISAAWLALLDHYARDPLGGGAGAGFAPCVLDPAAGHARFLQKTLPEN